MSDEQVGKSCGCGVTLRDGKVYDQVWCAEHSAANHTERHTCMNGDVTEPRGGGCQACARNDAVFWRRQTRSMGRRDV